MRRTSLVLILFALMVIGYLAWPIYAISTLARAIEARNAAIVMEHIDVSLVRKSLVDQLMDTYLKSSGNVGSPLLRGAVVRAAGTIADPLVAELLAPEAFADFLRTGWPTGVLAGAHRPAGLGGLTRTNLGSVWQIYRSATYGFRRFEISVPPSLPHDRRIELEFRVIKWRWQLAALRLPQYLRDELVERLIKAQSKS
jgi:hypothetical protein